MEAIAEFFVRFALTILGLATNAGNLTAPYVQSAVNEAWRNNAQIPLSPEEAATAVLKGIISPAQGEAEAANSGVSADRFAWMTTTLGNPPGVQELLYAYRRGLIDVGRLADGIFQSRIRDEWLGTITQLAYGPPAPGQAIAAAVEGHLDLGTAQRIMAEGGIDPANFQWLYDTAGRPAATEEMIKLWRRGIVAQTDVETAIRESNVKNKYIQSILATKLNIPPLFQLYRMTQNGGITPAQATTYLLDLGYDPAVAAGVVKSATTEKTSAHKTLTESMIASAYRAKMIDAPTATSHLVDIGYDATEAAFVLALEDHRETQAQLDRATTRIGSIYTAGRIDKGTASNDLSTLGVPADAQGRLFAIWDLERSSKVLTLTVAQLGAMVKKSLITGATMQARLVTMGYTDADAALLVALY